MVIYDSVFEKRLSGITLDAMESRGAMLSMALGIGVLSTVILTGAAYYIYEAGMESATRVLSWPNTLLQSVVPCHNIGTDEQPVCEGTPLNVAAYFASYLLSVAVYATCAYVLLRRRRMASKNALERTREG